MPEVPRQQQPQPAVPGGGPVHRGLAHLADRLRPRSLAAVTLLVGLAACALFTAGAGAVYDQVTEGDGLAGLDRPVLAEMVRDRTPGVTSAVRAYTDVGGPVGMPVLATVVLALVAWRRRSVEPLLLGVATAAGSLLMTLVGKAQVERLRPPTIDAVPPFETSFSFPSGHSLNSMALAAITAYVLVRGQHRTGTRVVTVVLAGVFAVTMGLSRVYLGHHWLTDVLVAWALALAWVAVVVTAHRWYLTTAFAGRRRERHDRLRRSTT
ncbi:phosphatase PAP2 family protein [Angustibacter aerolatus]|uniref:Phosphatidic acid phosphatase type 2/haloperoxidase domain-containing protein n=1 Tax=Angustibacter aerolatus TaxID=1162965 RepID=A0ABQ6JIR8_9ACTN|nr:phosphatase PAP2 family protein [Angustibacter aerolatus]GMA87140.1 hypothetical protein GCM10025868_23900 [Angustibacter aerolatus]